MNSPANTDYDIKKVEKRVFCGIDKLTHLPPYELGRKGALIGSEGQIKWASSIFKEKMAAWIRAGLPDRIMNALVYIKDAAWWISNKDAEINNIGWPSDWVTQSVQQRYAVRDTTADGDEFECPTCGIGRTDRASCQNPGCQEHVAPPPPPRRSAGPPVVGAPPTRQNQTSDVRPGAPMRHMQEDNGSDLRPKALLRHLPEEKSSDAFTKEDLDQFESFARKAANSPELAYLTMMALLYRQTKDKRVMALFSESRAKVQGHLGAIDKILGGK
jgi:hypothetical protein